MRAVYYEPVITALNTLFIHLVIDNTMTEKFLLKEIVSEELGGVRLDQVAVHLFPDYSRARLQLWIKSGNLLVDGKVYKAKAKLLGGETLTLEAEVEAHDHWKAEEIPLDIVFEDESIMVVNKPIGLVVHPAAGNRSGTLLNGLLFYCPALEGVPRAGIVHRLDKDTSGLMVVAKTLIAHQGLVEQIQDRSVNREYQAIVHGLVTAGDTVDLPLGRHPVHRTRRAVVSATGTDSKEAVTHYRLLKKFRAYTQIQVKLETGRTHQIRVHMSHIGFPLVGDQVYGGRPRIPKGASVELIEFLSDFKRQALHACSLGLHHPETDEYMEWAVDAPDDIQALLKLLEEDSE